MNLDKIIHAIETEELAREIESLSGNLATDIANLNLSTLPTSDPGGGKPWLNNGFLMVGTPS